MVVRITAVAELDERPTAAHATRSRADAGDRDSAWLLEQWQEQRLVLARLNVTALAKDSGGDEISAERVVDDVWLERDDLPAVEAQVADVAPVVLHALAAELRERGIDVDGDRLDASFLHVELGERLRHALADG